MASDGSESPVGHGSRTVPGRRPEPGGNGWQRKSGEGWRRAAGGGRVSARGSESAR
jgi:hypothetical protein